MERGSENYKYKLQTIFLPITESRRQNTWIKGEGVIFLDLYISQIDILFKMKGEIKACSVKDNSFLANVHYKKLKTNHLMAEVR